MWIHNAYPSDSFPFALDLVADQKLSLSVRIQHGGSYSSRDVKISVPQEIATPFCFGFSLEHREIFTLSSLILILRRSALKLAAVMFACD